MNTEADTCRKFVVPRLQTAGWEGAPHAINEQRTFTDGRVIFVGGKAKRGRQKRADYILRYRADYPIAVVEAKAANKQLARAPVDIVELDRDHLGRTRTEARHEQEHGIIALPVLRIGTNRREYRLDLVGRQISREPRIPALRHLGHAQRKVRARRARLEEILEEGPQMGGGRLIAIGRFATEQMLKEADHIAGRDRRQINIGIAEAMIEEAISEAPSMEDRPLAEPALTMKIVLIIFAQYGARDLLCSRYGRGYYAKLDEMFGKAPRDILALVRFVPVALFTADEPSRQVRSEVLGRDTARLHE